MAFLHGIEHIDLAADSTPVNDVVTAVIGLIGTHDSSANVEANKLYLSRSRRDDAQFGTNGTIAEALRAIRTNDSRRGGALVFVVSAGNHEDNVSASDIIGAISQTGERTGLQVFETALNKHGFEPMIFIAPRFSGMMGVRGVLDEIARKNEAMAYIDMQTCENFNQAILARGTSGDFGNMSEATKLLFPNFLVANPEFVDGETPEDEKFVNVPMSAYMAGVRARTDIENGWHWSASNQQVFGVEGMDIDLTFGISDRNSEANTLNAVGVTTAVGMFGRGIREWGNYTAGFPGNTNMEAFECVRRTRAIMKRSIERACVPFIDRPLNQANIDTIMETLQSYLDNLVSQGKLIFGQSFFRPENNPTSELQQGHIQFDIEFTPCAPMQRLTFTYKIDLSQFSNLF